MDHIGAIAELESCSYILFIYTSKICHHPYLRPPVKAKPSPIECQPLVSQAIYDEYLLKQQQPAETSDSSVGRSMFYLLIYFIPVYYLLIVVSYRILN